MDCGLIYVGSTTFAADTGHAFHNRLPEFFFSTSRFVHVILVKPFLDRLPIDNGLPLNLFRENDFCLIFFYTSRFVRVILVKPFLDTPLSSNSLLWGPPPRLR